MTRATRWVVILTGLLLATRSASAAGMARGRLQIVVLGSTVANDLLTAAVTPLLPESAIVDWKRITDSLTAEPTPPQTALDGPSIWIDARPKSTVRVVAFLRDSPPHVRIVDAPELTPVVAENVAQIVRETAYTLIADAASPPVSPAPVGLQPTPPPPSPAAAATSVPLATVAAAGNATTKSAKDLLFSAALVVRSDYGSNFSNAYGIQGSVAWSFRPPPEHGSRRPFTALSVGYLRHPEFRLYAAEIVQTVGLSWQPWSLLGFSLGVGAGAELAKIDGQASNLLFGRAEFGATILLPAGLEETLTVTQDLGQNLPARPSWYRSGLLLGLGWRPGS